MTACASYELDPPSDVIHARFDPDAKVIPMPTDILRDADAGHLDLPVDDPDLTPAELEFYGWMNTRDAWSSAMPATVELTAPIAAGTLSADSIQVWQWRETPRQVTDARVSIDEDEQKITIDAPRTGWARGGKYVVVLRGGAAGLEGKQGEKVECDAAFYFLRLTERLDVPEHERAFPGNTAAERRDNATKLEEIRVALAPYFEFFEGRGLPRTEVAALWEFTVTSQVELAMDKSSQRMPLPIDLLIDPATGRIDIPVAEWDSEVEARAKERLRAYDGFGTSANLMFGFTGPIDPESLDGAVELWETTDPPRRLPVDLTVLDDRMHVEIVPRQQPLPERSRFAVVVRDAVRDAEGGPIAIMPVGHFLKSQTPVAVGGLSEVDVVPDEDAVKVENVRGEVTDLLGRLDDDGDVLAAWSFTTMTVRPALDDLVDQPELAGVDPDPVLGEHMTPGQAAADFPLGITSLFNVGDVYTGTIESPIFLDKMTRAWRADNGHAIEAIPYTIAVPRNVSPTRPLPVVMFGHGIMTERRFVLAVADALAARGFATVAIDFPFHGDRTYCWSEGPLSIPNPQTGELTPLADPCLDGFTCAADGRCVDAANQGNHLRDWPIIGMHQASGAAFIEIEHIANTRDHFQQTVVDLAALSYSLRRGDWEAIIGAPIDGDQIHYLGQSLGGIIGATFVALSPEIKRAVLNVPGADTVDLFDNSGYFGTHVQAFFDREQVARDSYEGYRFMNVARWFMDAADPQGVADRLLEGNRDVLLQMATLDFIIPNEYTLKLEELSGAPRKDYVAEHAFLAIPIEPEYLRGVNDMASFIEEGP
jgi:pimeloyl-ACP methyl ester carboxylesterase